MELKPTLVADYPLVSAESHVGHPSSTTEVLQEIFELLEEFSPVWYTEELHTRAVTALKVKKGM
jgi:hypothetical protein